MEDQEYMPDIYTLEDEDGNEMIFEMLDQMELNGNQYYAMMPYFEDPDEMLEDDGQLVILRGEDVNGEEMMASIDDDEEYDRVGAIFMERISKMFDEEED